MFDLSPTAPRPGDRSKETRRAASARDDASGYLRTLLLNRALEGAAPPAGFIFRYRLLDDDSLMVEVLRDRDDQRDLFPLFGAVVARHDLLRQPAA